MFGRLPISLPGLRNYIYGPNRLNEISDNLFVRMLIFEASNHFEGF